LPPALPEQPLPVLAAGLPAELLARRPDLQAAELRLRESLANVDLTRASFYPKLSLTGSLGTSSDALLRLVQNPVASLAAQL
ncbi:TolC family protein, partial [Acinetobacter baumannii]